MRENGHLELMEMIGCAFLWQEQFYDNLGNFGIERFAEDFWRMQILFAKI